LLPSVLLEKQAAFFFTLPLSGCALPRFFFLLGGHCSGVFLAEVGARGFLL